MNFYNSIQSLPMAVQTMDPLKSLIQSVEGSYRGYRPQYVTPCIRRRESLVQITEHMACHPVQYTGWVMIEVWSYNPQLLRDCMSRLGEEQFRYVAAAIPQPRRRSLFLLVHSEVFCHADYVRVHRSILHEMRRYLPPMLHLRPNLGNETAFLNLLQDCECYYREDYVEYSITDSDDRADRE